MYGVCSIMPRVSREKPLILLLNGQWRVAKATRVRNWRVTANCRHIVFLTSPDSIAVLMMEEYVFVKRTIKRMTLTICP